MTSMASLTTMPTTWKVGMFGQVWPLRLYKIRTFSPRHLTTWNPRPPTFLVLWLSAGAKWRRTRIPLWRTNLTRHIWSYVLFGQDQNAKLQLSSFIQQTFIRQLLVRLILKAPNCFAQVSKQLFRKPAKLLNLTISNFLESWWHWPRYCFYRQVLKLWLVTELFHNWMGLSARGSNPSLCFKVSFSN